MDRKTRKRYFQSKGGGSTAKKGKRGRLEPGMKGFLVTCSNNDESKCVREAYNLLNEYLDRMGGDKSVDDGEKGKEERSDKIQPENPAPSNNDSDEEEDLESALKKECDQLTGRDPADGDSSSKNPESKQFTKRFMSMDTGVSNNIFVATSADLDPCAMVHSILKDIKDTGKSQSRFIQRMLPVEISCKAYIDDIERALIANKDLLSKHFAQADKDADPPSYAIFYKARNNDHLRREDILRAVGDLIVATNPMVKVDLEKPKKAILVEVLQTVACMSIVEDYMEFSKYNLHLVGKPA